MQTDIKGLIREKIVEIAHALGNDASSIREDEVIPETGLLDSAGLMELMLWYEQIYGEPIETEELTTENFGTIKAMANYLKHHRNP